MGAQFDFMDELSHYTATAEQVGEAAVKNRKILRAAMEQFGFEAYAKEFWHFSYGGRAGHEVTSPLDIEITPELMGVGVIYASKSQS
jgi:D-alanyl-D-alanine dipeptidase